MRVHSSNKGRQFSFQLNRLAVISSRLSSFSTSNLSSKVTNFAAIFLPSRRDVRLLPSIASCVCTSKLLSWRRGIQIFRYRILNLTVSVYCRKNKCPVPMGTKSKKKQQLAISRQFHLIESQCNIMLCARLLEKKNTRTLDNFKVTSYHHLLSLAKLKIFFASPLWRLMSFCSIPFLFYLTV